MAEDMQATDGMVAQSQVASQPAVETAMDTSNSAPAEKMIPQSKVDEIIKDRLRHKESRLRSEYESKMQTMQAPQQQAQMTQNMGGMQQASYDDIQRMVEEATKKQQETLSQQYLQYVEQEQAQKVAKEYLGKVNAAKEKYPDFDTKVGALQVEKIPSIVHLANSVSNTAEVMYDLAENPQKLASILQFANDPSTYHLAQIAITKLSDSIQMNESAKSQPSINPPLSQVKSSSAATDNGKSTIRDLRRQSWLRG